MRISGERVVLRPLSDDDLSTLGVGMPPVREGSEAHAIVRAHDATPIGRIQYLAPRSRSGWLTIDFIELAPQLRGWGYGSEAVKLLEDETTRLGLAQRFRADVPLHNGLALYFWLRMGYRPTAPTDAFWRSDEGGDTMAMIHTPK